MPLSLRHGNRLASAIAVILLVTPHRTVAQRPLPPGWTLRTDAGDARAAVQTVEMRPGFHVTTGPAAILFDSTQRASGNWRLEATLHLFDPGARAEGFGVIFGGRDLTGPAPQYGYALVRRDGRALLKVREGAATRTVRDWAASGGIPVWKSGIRDASVRYDLVVEAIGDRITLWVGPTRVLDAARTEMPTDGIVGVRINHGLNVHVEKVTVAPVARR